VEEKVLKLGGFRLKLLLLDADLIIVGIRRFFYLMMALGYACGWPATGASWDGPEDNKSPEELQEMDEPTLAWEAEGPCVRAAITSIVVSNDTISKRKEALRYLTAMLVAKRKKDGKIPPWLYEMASQAEKGSAPGCNDTAQKVYLPPPAPPEGQAPDAQAAAKDAPAESTKKKKKK
jgi:hypothetical protein